MAKFLTLNTHSWMEAEQEAKFQAVADRIASEKYDLICLQEVNQELTSQEVAKPFTYQSVESIGVHEDHYALSLVEGLAKRGLTYYWSWAYNHIGFDRFHEGVAILSKSPIKARSLVVSDMDDETNYRTRKVLLAETQLGERMVTVASVHLSWWDKGFQAEWQRLEKVLLAEENPLILMGDFNNPEGQEGYQAILESPLKLKDSHKAAQDISGQATVEGDIAGWDGNKAALKIDYIFTSSDFDLLSSKVVFDGQNGAVVSDHFGLEVEAEMKSDKQEELN